MGHILCPVTPTKTKRTPKYPLGIATGYFISIIPTLSAQNRIGHDKIHVRRQGIFMWLFDTLAVVLPANQMPGFELIAQKHGF